MFLHRPKSPKCESRGAIAWLWGQTDQGAGSGAQIAPDHSHCEGEIASQKTLAMILGKMWVITKLVALAFGMRRLRPACDGAQHRAAADYQRPALRIASVTRARSSSLMAVPEGRQRPSRNHTSATVPPTTSQPAKAGCMCIGFQSGRASMFSASGARRSASPQNYGTILMILALAVQ